MHFKTVLLPKTDKLDYLRSPITEFFLFLVLTSGKFLEALESRIGTCSVFCHSFSLSNNVHHNLTYWQKIKETLFPLLKSQKSECTYIFLQRNLV